MVKIARTCRAIFTTPTSFHFPPLLLRLWLGYIDANIVATNADGEAED